MRSLLAVAGLTIVVLATIDTLTTAVSVGSGAGPLTRRISTGLWHAARSVWPRHHVALRRAGICVMLGSIMAWLVLTWLGWTLVFLASEQAVVSTATGEAATLDERVYFTGYTLLTLGNGDFQPGGPVWRIATVLAAANGFALVTLGITYLVPVASAATEKRQMAAGISALGATPTELLQTGFDGEGFALLGRELGDLPQQLLLHQQRHQTYPALHYFHSAEASRSAPLRLAALDEALTILQAAVPASVPRPEVRLGRVRTALTGYLETLGETYVHPADEPPPLPRLDAVRAAGIPTVDDETFAARMVPFADRRRLLRGVVEHDGWGWDDVADAP